MVSESFLKKVAILEKMKVTSRLKRAPTPAIAKRIVTTPTVVQRVIKRVTPTATTIKKPSVGLLPSSPLEVLSPALYLANRSLSPAGALITMTAPQKEKEKRLIDFGGAIGAITPEGKLTELGEQIKRVGQTVKTVTAVAEKGLDWKTWALIGGGALAIIMFMRK